MRNVEIAQYQMFVRIRDFWSAHRHLLPETKVSATAFKDLEAAVAVLASHAGAETTIGQKARRAKGAAREALVERLLTIARTARVIARNAPGFDERFSLPKEQSEETLPMAGRAFLSSLTPVEDRFIDYGMPLTFIADLQDLVLDFEQAIRERDEGRNAQSSADIVIRGAISSGYDAAYTLDTMVFNQLGKKSDVVNAWRAACGTSRRIKVPRARKTPVPSRRKDPD